MGRKKGWSINFQLIIMATPYLNDSAVKKLALQFSKKNRAGKFKRVGSSFLERINSQVVVMIAAEVKSEEDPCFLNKTEVKKLAERIVHDQKVDRKVNGVIIDRINRKLVEMVQGEVHRHPSIGKTLQ